MATPTKAAQYAAEINKLETEQITKARAAIETREKARAELQDAERAVYETEAALEGINARWRAGDTDLAEEEHMRAQAAHAKAVAVYQGIKARAESKQADRLVTDCAVAELVAELFREHSDDEFLVIATAASPQDLPEPDDSLLPVVVVAQTSPTLVLEDGPLSARCHVTFYRKAYYAQLDLNHIFTLGAEGDRVHVEQKTDYGDGQVYGRFSTRQVDGTKKWVDTSELNVRAAIPKNPVLSSAPITEDDASVAVMDALRGCWDCFTDTQIRNGEVVPVPFVRMSAPRVLRDEVIDGQRYVTVSAATRLDSGAVPARVWDASTIRPSVGYLAGHIQKRNQFVSRIGRLVDIKCEMPGDGRSYASSDLWTVTVEAVSKAA